MICYFQVYNKVLYNWIYICVCVCISVLLSHVQLFATPWTAACQVSLSITNSRSLLKLMTIELVMPSNHLIHCHPLLLPSVFPTSGSFPVSLFFASGGQSIRVSASTSVLPMNTQNWLPLGLNLLAVQWTLKSLLPNHSSKASIHWHSDIFIVQLTHPYMTTVKTIALTRQIFVGKVLSLFLKCCLGWS